MTERRIAKGGNLDAIMHQTTPEQMAAGRSAFRRYEADTDFMDGFSAFDEDVERLVGKIYSAMGGPKS